MFCPKWDAHSGLAQDTIDKQRTITKASKAQLGVILSFMDLFH